MNPAIERLIGRAFYRLRARDRHLAWNAPALAAVPDGISLGSPAFAAHAAMPPRHAGDGVGDNLSPPLAWSGVPTGTAELVLIIEDPDAPLPRPVVHAIATGIPPHWQGLPEGALARVGRHGPPRPRLLRPDRLCGAASGARPWPASLYLPACRR